MKSLGHKSLSQNFLGCVKKYLQILGLSQWSPTFLSPRTGLRLIILPQPTKREGEMQIVFNLLVFEHAFKIKLFES